MTATQPIKLPLAVWVRICDAVSCSPDFGPSDVAAKIETLTRRSRTDAEQLVQLRKATTRLLKALEMQEQRDSKPYRRMSQRDIQSALFRAKEDARVALNPSHLQKETQR